jgi:hypothetical protein
MAGTGRERRGELLAIVRKQGDAEREWRCVADGVEEEEFGCGMG